MSQKERHVAFVDAEKWRLAKLGGLVNFSGSVNNMLKPYVERGKQREIDKVQQAKDAKKYDIGG